MNVCYEFVDFKERLVADLSHRKWLKCGIYLKAMNLLHVYANATHMYGFPFGKIYDDNNNDAAKIAPFYCYIFHILHIFRITIVKMEQS